MASALGTLTIVSTALAQGPVELHRCTLTGDADYPAGGTTGLAAALVDALGRNVTIVAVVDLGNHGDYLVAYDYTNEKVYVRVISTGAQATGDLHTSTYNLLIITKLPPRQDSKNAARYGLGRIVPGRFFFRTEKVQTMTTMFARIRPSKVGTRTFTVNHIRYAEIDGWREVTPDVVDLLREQTINGMPNGQKVFDVCTHAEALALDRQESQRSNPKQSASEALRSYSASRAGVVSNTSKTVQPGAPPLWGDEEDEDPDATSPVAPTAPVAATKPAAPKGPKIPGAPKRRQPKEPTPTAGS